MRNYIKKKKNPQKEVDPCKTHIGLLTRAYQSKTPPLLQRPRDRGPVSGVGWKQTVNFLTTLSVLR